MCSNLTKKYLYRSHNLPLVVRFSTLIKTRQKIFLEDNNHNSLPKGEKNGYLNGQKFEQGRVRSQWFVQSMVKENQIVQRIRR